MFHNHIIWLNHTINWSSVEILLCIYIHKIPVNHISIHAHTLPSVDGFMARFEGDSWSSHLLHTTCTFFHGVSTAFIGVRRLLWSAWHLCVVVHAHFTGWGGVVWVVMAVFVVKCLQAKATVRMLAAPATLRYVRIVFTHCLCLIDL